MRTTVAAACLATGLLASGTAARGEDNLLFVPLQPCRVIDTRVPGAGGPLVAGTPRSFVFRGPTLNYQNPAPFPNQGGSITGCGIADLTSDSSPNLQNIARAVAINVIAVGPSGAGDLRAWPANRSIPQASVVNYAAVPGLNVANGVIVPMCDELSPTPCTGGDITFQADVRGAHLVVDVVGYFHAGSAAYTTKNTALGHDALKSNTTGRSNTAIGVSAQASNTTGHQNTATGGWALGSNTTGAWNTATGFGALSANTTGIVNTATGLYALAYNTTGQRNTASGGSALFFNTSGNFNTADGYGALYSNTTGGSNTASGFEALYTNSTGTRNVASGYKALLANTTGGSNTASGAYALSSNTDGLTNTALGYGALRNTTGSSNIGVGAEAGSNATSGNGNIFIGNPGADGDSGVLRLGNAQTQTFIAGIRGVTTVNDDAVAVLIDSSGQLGTVSSSLRVKQDIEDLGEASDRILALRPVKFRYKAQAARGDSTAQFGLIAEEVERVLPELVVRGRDGEPETVKYHVLPALLLGALQREHETLLAQRQDLADQGLRLAAALESLEAQRRRNVDQAAIIRELLARVAALERAQDAPAP